MKLIVNGQEINRVNPISIKEFLDELNINPLRVAVELNMKIVHRDKYEVTLLKDGDKIEIVHFVGGGK